MINWTNPTQFGIDATFWAPINSKMDHRTGTVETFAGGWPSAAHYEAGVQPLLTKNHYFSPEQIVSVLGGEVALTQLVVALMASLPDYNPPPPPEPDPPIESDNV